LYASRWTSCIPIETTEDFKVLWLHFHYLVQPEFLELMSRFSSIN
jgi:hypothetical protein